VMDSRLTDAAVTVRVLGELAIEATGLLMTTLNLAPLSAVVVGGVV
jgi:hypothetical protein